MPDTSAAIRTRQTRPAPGGTGRRVIVPLVIMLLLGCLTSPLEANLNTLIMAYPSSTGSFTIVGNNLDKPMEIEMQVSYQSDNQDPPLVSGPSLDRKKTTLTTTFGGPGALTLQLKSKIPLEGTKALAIVRIYGTISNLSAVMRYANGTTRNSQVSIVNPTPDQLAEMAALNSKTKEPDPPANNPPAASETPAPAAPAPVKTDIPAVVPQGAVVNQETQAAGRRDADPAPDSDLSPRTATTPSAQGGRSAGKAAPAREEEDDPGKPVTFTRRESLFARFSALSGERTPAALALLLQQTDPVIHQEPPLAVSDGSSIIRLEIRVTGSSRRSPQFILSGATCSGLKISNSGTWLLEVVPKRGVLEASVIILSGREATEYPLAVAPPLKEPMEYVPGGTIEAEYVTIAARLATAGKAVR